MKGRGGKIVNRKWVASVQPPFVPKRYTDEFHNTGNSIGYCVQHAHLMGAAEIVLLGFTLQAGSPYEDGRMNPLTNRPSIYATERSIDYLRWFAQQFPGRVRLGKGWDGPLYEARLFEEIDLDTPEGLTPNLPWRWMPAP